ncbi:ComEC/Rec2 family competence protein [Patescibacteria group bacterium]
MKNVIRKIWNLWNSTNRLIYICICFVLGILIGTFVNLQAFYIFATSLIVLILIIVFKNFKEYIPFLFGIFFLLLGLLRFEISQPEINAQHIAFYTNKSIEFNAQIMHEPDIRESYQKLTLGKIKYTNKLLKGYMLINTEKHEEYKYKDILNLQCKLEAPGKIKIQDKKDFDYGAYLAMNNIYATCNFPQIISRKSLDTLSTNQKIKNKLINARQKFKQTIDTALPLPYSGILNAMLLGYKREVPTNVSNNFSQAGVSHIIAISGLHIGILATLIFFIFIFLGIRRQIAFWPSIIIISTYVLLIGWRASALRALIMVGFVLYALKIGRVAKPLNFLMLAAGFLLLLNPKLLWYDIGFQLSFLAVLGIICFYNLFFKYLKFITIKYNIRSLVAMTLSAQILTTPLVVYNFQVFSLISPITNLLILPVLPILLVLGIILILSGLMWSKLVLLPAFIIWLILNYILKIVEFLTQIPLSYFEF